MTPLHLTLVLSGGAFVAAVLAFVRERRARRELIVRFGQEREKAALLPNRGTKFRIVYYTEVGARARDYYAQTRTHGTDICEFWHHETLRDKKGN